MAARPIREVQGLDIVYKHINDNKAENGGLEPVKYFAIESLEDLESATQNHPWILNEVSFIIFLSSFYLTQTNFNIPKLISPNLLNFNVLKLISPNFNIPKLVLPNSPN